MTLEPAWPVLFTLLGIVEIARMWGYPRRRAAADICVALLFLDGLINDEDRENVYFFGAQLGSTVLTTRRVQTDVD